MGLRSLAMWRVQQGPRWSDEQLVALITRDLRLAEEVQRPARMWAHRQSSWKTKEGQGNRQIESPDGARWLCRSKDNAYGLTLALAMVDEAWDIQPSIVDEGIEPTIVERQSGQVGLTSTAHRLATGLMLSRRQTAFAQLREPRDTLVLEWSAPWSADRSDPATWRLASPHWSDARESLIARKLEQAQSGESVDPTEPDPIQAFDAQWLNRWPLARVARLEGDPLLVEGVWADLLDTSAVAVDHLVAAMEDHFGEGAAVALAGVTRDGRIFTTGMLFERRADAFTWAYNQADDLDALLIGASLSTEPAVVRVQCPVVIRGTHETRRALSQFRELTTDRHVVHDGNPELAEQILSIRVRHQDSGLGIVSKTRTDLARCAMWAVTYVHQQQSLQPGVG